MTKTAGNVGSDKKHGNSTESMEAPDYRTLQNITKRLGEF